MMHFKANKSLAPWGKGFLTSLLGTTISILLTFGTSALIDSKMKADVQRQTAMMVIHDIDVCVAQMEKRADNEEKRNNAVQYILEHQDQIASLPADTLELAMEMLVDYDGDPSVFDNAKENIFKSSQDIWSNLDNMAFIDNMERFYRERREFEAQTAKNPIFVEPITFEEYCQLRINSTADDHEVDIAGILKERLKDRKVKFHIDYSTSRTRFYREFAQRWRDISDRNKFIMNISDEELTEYIKSSQRSGSSVGKRDLMGLWERKASGFEHHYYHFQDNDSFCRKRVSHIAYPVWNGEIVITQIYGGTWSLKGDTLLMVCNPESAEVELDTSRITYRPEMRDSVRNLIGKHMDVKVLKQSLREAIEDDIRDTFPVTTNKAHDKIEMVVSGSNDEIRTRYLKRIKNSDVFNK